MGMSVKEKNKFMEESKERFKEWHDMNYIPKDQYEARLKSDMVAMLKELDLKMQEIEFARNEGMGIHWKTTAEIRKEYSDIIQEKINALERNEDGNKNA